MVRCLRPLALALASLVVSSSAGGVILVHRVSLNVVDILDEDTAAYLGELKRELIFDATAMIPSAEGNVLLGWPDRVVEIDAHDGDLTTLVVDPTLQTAAGLALEPAGTLLVSSFGADRVLRLDPVTGVVLGPVIHGDELALAAGLAFAPDGTLLVADAGNGLLLHFDGVTGARIIGRGLAVAGPRGLAFGPDGMLYVASTGLDAVMRVDPSTGAVLGSFASGGGLSDPEGILFRSDGLLYVVSSGTDQVLRYDGATGAFQDVFAAGAALSAPRDAAFGPDGRLYVTNGGNAGIARFDGSTGVFVDVFVAEGSGSFRGLAFAPGYLVALHETATGARQIRRYDAATGAPSGILNAGDADSLRAGPGGLLFAGQGSRVQRYGPDPLANLGPFAGQAFPDGPATLRWGADGHLYVTASGSGHILRYDAGDFTLIDVFATGVTGSWVFGPDGDVYATDEAGHAIVRFDGATGAPLGVFATGGGMIRPRAVRFGPDGRLYVGTVGNASGADALFRFDGVTGAFLGTFDDTPFGSRNYAVSDLLFSDVTGALPGLPLRIGPEGDGTHPLVDPTHVATSPDGTLWVATSSNDVFRVAPDGSATRVLDATAPLAGVTDLAAGPAGDALVAGNDRTLHWLHADGSRTTIFDGSQFAAMWSWGGVVAFGADGTPYGASANNRVYRFDSNGSSTLLMNHLGDQQGNQFSGPSGLLVAPNGDLFVAGASTENIFRRSSAGVVTEVFDAAEEHLGAIFGLERDLLGNLYTTTSGRVVRIAPGGSYTSILTSNVGFSDVAIDGDGDAYALLPQGDLYQISSHGVATYLADLVGLPLGFVAAGSRRIVVAPSGNLVVASLAGNAVFELPIPPECSDGIDNDGDGDIDVGGDPGCLHADFIEGPACDDDRDNDGDGKTDWDGGSAGGTPDPTCTQAHVLREAPSCGLGAEPAGLLALLAWARHRRRTASLRRNPQP